MTKVKIVALPAGKTSMNVIVPKTIMEPEKPKTEGFDPLQRLHKVMFPTLLSIDDPEQAGTLAFNSSYTQAQSNIELSTSMSVMDYFNQKTQGYSTSSDKPGFLNVTNAKKDLRGVATDIHQSYVNKINASMDPNEKLYAFDQIRKIFGDGVPLNEDGSFGTIGQMMDKAKSKAKPSLVSDDLAARMGKPASKVNWDNPAFKQVRYDPTLYDADINDNDAEKTFNNAVQVFEKDPLFRDDPASVDIVSKIQGAQLKFQDSKNKAIIDQINIGTIRDYIETDAARLGFSAETKDDIINNFFVNLGKSGSGKNKYAAKSYNGHLNDLRTNPRIDKVASQLADMAIMASRQDWEAKDEYDMWGNPLSNSTEDIFNRAGGNRGEEDKDDVFEQFEAQAQDLLGMNQISRMYYTERNIASLVDKLNEKGIDGKQILKNIYLEKWARGGREKRDIGFEFSSGIAQNIDELFTKNNNFMIRNMGKNIYNKNPDIELANNMLEQSGASAEQRKEFMDAYENIPLTGYDQFQEVYGRALSNKDLNLLNYNANFIGIKGQGGKGAAPNEIGIDASLPLSMNATGNQWAISVIDNLMPNIAGKFDEKGKYSIDYDNIDDREDMKYNQKVYVFDKPLKDVREELDPGHEKDFFGGREINVEDWDWSNSWGNLTDKTLDGLHIDALDNNAATILAAYRNALYNQEDVGQASTETRATGKLITYPVTLNAEDMTGYEIKISGKWLKKKGFQSDDEDKIYSMAIPKSMANNLAFKAVQSKDDMVDRAIMANGSYAIKNPGGNATITMDDNGDYITTGTLNTYDVNSGVLKTTILPKQTFSSFIYKGDKLADIVKQMLVNQQRNIQAIEDSNRANSKNKIYSPQQLLQQLTQQ
jgi:hypothetical protein